MTTQTSRRPYWHAELCPETATEITERMREILEGHHHTLVLANSYDENSNRYLAIDVHASQRLTSPIELTMSDNPDRFRVHIGWSCPSFSMGISTDAKTRKEARDSRPHKFVRVSFEPDKVTIDHYAPAGYKLLWILAVERHDTEDGAS